LENTAVMEKQVPVRKDHLRRPRAQRRCHIPLEWLESRWLLSYVASFELPGAYDLVEDPVRNRLYVTSLLDNKLYRYDLSTKTFLTPYTLGGDGRSVDLSADHSTLYVSTTTNTLEAFNLASDASVAYTLPATVTDAHWVTALGGGDVLLGTPNGVYSFDPDTQLFALVDGTFPQTLVRNATRTHALAGDFGPGLTGPRAFRRFDGVTRASQLTLPFSITNSYSNALSPSGDRIAYPELNGAPQVAIYNFAGQRLATLDGAAAAFDPVRPYIYTLKSGTLSVYNSNTYQLVTTVAAGTGFSLGIFRINDDGTKLMWSNANVVGAFDLNGVILTEMSPIAATSVGAPASFTLTLRNLDGEIRTDYRGWVRVLSAHSPMIFPIDYTYTEADAGVHTFSFTPITRGTFNVYLDGMNDEVYASRDVTVAGLTPPLQVTGNAVGGRLVLTAVFNLVGMPAGHVPAGTFTFRNNGTVIGNVSLANGGAQLVTNLMPPTNQLTVTYSGDVAFEPKEVAGTMTVAAQETFLSLTIPPNNQPSSPSIPLAAQVLDSNGSPVNAGNVYFQVYYPNNTPFPVGSGTAFDASGRSTVNVLNLPPGTWKIIASYIPAYYYAYTSISPVLLTVSKAGAAVSLSSTNGILKATVTGAAGGQPQGNVVFREGDAVLATVTLVNGEAFYDYRNLAVGSHPIRATYEGSIFYETAVSAAQTVTVTPPPQSAVVTSTALTASVLAPVPGQTVQLTATVSPAATGTITFYNGETALGTAALNNGAATFATTFAVGMQTLVAKYAPTGNFAASNSSPLKLNVTQPTVVDLLAVYHPATLSRLGSTTAILQKLHLLIEDTNTALVNSGVTLTLRLASLSFVNYAESGSMSTDLTRLGEPDDGYLDNVMSLRTTVGADLVVMLNSDSTDSEGHEGFVTSGISYTLLDPSSPSRDEVAFLVIDSSAPRGEYLLAHEVAHSFGATHALGDTSSGGAVPYSHGYRFFGNDGVQYHDIMAYEPGTLIPYFSNPAITYKGRAIGSASTANVARLLNEQAPLVANYRSGRVIGGVDVSSNTMLAGWFLDPRAFGNALTMRIDIDGQTRGMLVASSARNDLYSAFGTVNHGFSYTLPPLAAGHHAVNVYVQDASGAWSLAAARVVTAITPLFDESYYLAKNADIAAAVKAGQFATGFDHFQRAGQFERRNPSVWFDTGYYLEKNPDLATAAGKGQLPSPYAHYLGGGQYEGRLASPYYDERFYRLANPDIAAAIGQGALKNGLEHFLLYGQYEGRTALPYFDATYYRLNNASVPAEQMRSPIGHFVNTGNAAGLNPSGDFSQATYLAKNPDIATAVANKQFVSGLDHYLRYGRAQGRSFSNAFSEASYLAKNPDIAAAVRSGIFSCGFEHWLLAGRFENRAV
jgi:hypothetical protein